VDVLNEHGLAADINAFAFGSSNLIDFIREKAASTIVYINEYEYIHICSASFGVFLQFMYLHKVNPEMVPLQVLFDN
jgi:hypothetical protein